MTLDVLLREFGRLVISPIEVEHLRDTIITLAVSGRLSEQNESEKVDTSAFNDAPWSDGDDPLPPNWRCAPLVKLVDFVYGKGLPADRRFDEGPIAVYGSNGVIAWTDIALSMEPAIIVGRKGSAGALVLSTGPSWTTDVAYYVIPPKFLVIEYLILALRSLRLDTLGKGVKPGLSRSDLQHFPLAVPPLPEQARIVARVSELMAICDELEAAQHEREIRRGVARRIAISQLMTGDGFEVPRASVQFFLSSMAHLVVKPEHVESIRQAILDLAVKGCLLPQNPQDEPANALLGRIQQERNSMLAAGFPNEAEARTQLKKQGSQQLPDDLPQLPIGWAWATLMQCSAIVVDCRNKTAPYTPSGVVLLRTTNIRNGRVVLGGHRYVSEETYRVWTSRYEPQPGDIIITREAPMGEVAKIPPELRVCLGQRLMLCRLVEETLDADFLVYSLRDSNLMSRVRDKPIGALVEHLRVGGVETLLIAVPPLAEQKRVVAKIDELMELCDALKTALAESTTTRSRLLLALLNDALKNKHIEMAVTPIY
jgi:type I restriction enzyme, S subunit